MTDKRKTLLADFSLLLVALIWGSAFVTVKNSLDTIPPLMMMAFRFTIATVIIYILFHKKIGKITLSDLKSGALIGFVLYTGYALQTIGLKYTTASKQGFLTSIYVILVPFMYWLVYKKSPGLKVYIASALAIIGIGLISLSDQLTINLGDTLTLICAIFFALQILLIEFLGKKMNAMKLTFLQMLMTAIFSTITSLMFEPFRLNLNAGEWYSMLYLGIFSTVICYSIQTVAQKYTSSSHASLLMSMESVFAASFGVWLLGDVFTIKLVIGSALVFVAILIVEIDIFPKRSPKNSE